LRSVRLNLIGCFCILSGCDLGQVCSTRFSRGCGAQASDRDCLPGRGTGTDWGHFVGEWAGTLDRLQLWRNASGNLIFASRKPQVSFVQIVPPIAKTRTHGKTTLTVPPYFFELGIATCATAANFHGSDATTVERVTGVTMSITEPYEGSYAGFPGVWAVPATFTALAPASSAPAMPSALHPRCFGEKAEKSPASASYG